MKILEVEDLSSGLQQLQRLMNCRPVVYFGRYYCFHHDRTLYFYRSKKPIQNFMLKNGTTELSIATIGK